MNFPHQKIQSKFDGLYDRVKADRDDFMSEEEFQVTVDELVDTGFIETSVLDDDTLYCARAGLKWSEFVHIDDGFKKSILLLLVENPTTFFILVNTQGGKMGIASRELKLWGNDATKKVVAFLITDNDKTLTDQSVDGLLRVFGEQKLKIFTLSSNSKLTFYDIRTYIDAYEGDKSGEYAMPLIALLGNKKQCEKKLRLQNHIANKVRRYGSLLRYGEIWDEADKIYPSLRDMEISIDGRNVSSRHFIIDDTVALYRLGFVTATDGELLEEEYPECTNAYLYPIDIDEQDRANYRALHHPDAITTCVPFTSKHTNNSYALQILEANDEHFKTPLTLRNGELYYRKSIVNSNAKTDDMKNFAKTCIENGYHAMVFNGYGGASVKVFRRNGHTNMPVFTMKTRGRRFNEVLFYLYKVLKLNDKPLVIIGRRKVDRGLGFHYSPKTSDPITLDFDIPLTTSNKEGLIWTDMILGRVGDKNTAVQKAGRLAGIIGASPQYHGHINYWTDEYTEGLVRRHNTIVDEANTMMGYSVLQAVKHAEDTVPETRVNHRVDLKTFRVYNNEDTVRAVCAVLGYAYRATAENANGFRETSLNTERAVVSLLDAIKKVPTAYGTNNGVITYRTCYPCYKTAERTSLHFVVIIRPGDHVKLAAVDTAHPPISIPQTGDF